jgi:hypothetical protein
MLRTITNIIISSLLLVSTTGLAMSKHYCEGEFISVELKTESDPCCDDSTCCHTETQFLQVENDFLTSFTNFSLEAPFAPQVILTSSEVEMKPVRINYNISFVHSGLHPRCTGIRLALQQVYRL